MMLDERKWAGMLIFLAGAQFSVFLVIAEAIYPGYSVSGNFISDLGVGPAANVFNGSVILLGLLAFGAVYVSRRLFDRVLLILLLLTGIGAVGVGVFTEAFGGVHTVVSFIAFVFAGLSAIWSSRFVKPPLSYVAIVLGVFGLLALVLFAAKVYLGLDQGGMERMIVYPVLAWAMSFGGYMMAEAPAG